MKNKSLEYKARKAMKWFCVSFFSGALLLTFSANSVLAESQTETAESSEPTVILKENSKFGPGFYEYDDQTSIEDVAGSANNSAFLRMARSITYQQAFINKIKQAAILSGSKGILPSITAAQAAVESQWGVSKLTTQANNYFGIKGTYNGQSVTMATQEYSSTEGYYTINAAFRKYPSIDASFADHTNFLLENSRYKNLINKKDYHEVANLLQQDGYATAPNYAQTLINIIDSYGLASWDGQVGIQHESEDIAEIKYVAGYGIMSFNLAGTRIADSNKKFLDGTRWKTFGSTVIDGEEMYLVGTNEYVPKKYTDHNDDGVITINYAPGYGVNAVNSEGKAIAGSNLKFKTGTRWNIVHSKVINGDIYYLVGVDTYIAKRYTQWGEGK